jgi:sec-independent protein translocase protein TatA
MPNLGPTELIIILLIVVLLFGARKLPDTARGLGRAMRIFKSETKGLHEDEPQQQPSQETSARPEPPRQIPPASSTESTPPSASPAPERERDER